MATEHADQEALTKLFDHPPKGSRRILVSRGNRLYERGSDALPYLLIQGIVSLRCNDPMGRDFYIEFERCKPPAILGEDAFVCPPRHRNYALALTDCQVLGFDNLDGMQQVLSENPTILWMSLINLIHRLTDDKKKLFEIGFMDIPQRVSSLLLQSCDGAVYGRQVDLAAQIFAQRVSVSKALMGLQTLGAICVKTETIQIVDRRRLERYTGPQY